MILAEIDVKERLENLNWDFQSSNAELIHSIHPYPAKFIPEIPRTLIANLPIPWNTLILDPFCGSGVTLAEAQKVGIESVGIDLNPIACLLSKVKTQALPENFISSVNEIVKNSKSSKANIHIPAIPNLDHWFKKEIQVALATLLYEIDKTNFVLQDALKFCFSSIIVKVSNQDSDTRYAAVEKRWRKDDVFQLFGSSAEKLWKAKSETTFNQTPSTIINKNALLVNQNDVEKKVGLIITSPPYPNAYEYWLYHKYRMWWLGYDPIGVKENEIGARAHYFKKNHQTADDFIDQMETLLQGLADLCVRDAFLCFIIGQSKIHGKIIENEKLIKNIGEKTGLNHITTLKREIRQGRKSFNLSHARINEEYIVVLQKKKI